MTKRHTFSHAVKWAIIAALGKRGIGAILTFVLAIILGPEDFGLVAMAMAYIAFLEMFVTQGLAASIIQRKDLEEDHLHSAFWLLMCACAVLSGVCWGLSGAWAAANKTPELGTVIRVLTLSLPIMGLTLVPRALLQRRMEFRSLALLRSGASVLSGVVGIVMALWGCGVWSLVTQQLLYSALSAVMMWWACAWRPAFRISGKHTKDLVGFSAGVFVAQTGQHIAMWSDTIIMGLFFGPTAVGVYRLAMRLAEEILNVGTRSVQVVSLPHLSEHQDDRPRLRAEVFRCVRVGATMTIPLLGILAATGDELMRVLGGAWLPAGSVIEIVAIMTMVNAATVFYGPLLLARGRTTVYAITVWGLGLMTAGALAAVGSTLMAAELNEQMVAVAGTKAIIFGVLWGGTGVVISRWLCGMTIRNFISAIGPGVQGALGAIAVGLLTTMNGRLEGMPPLAALIAVGVPSASAAMLAMLFSDAELRRRVRDVLTSRSAATAAA
jgi:O-antigen/teichoic acid export membrane protein